MTKTQSRVMKLVERCGRIYKDPSAARVYGITPSGAQASEPIDTIRWIGLLRNRRLRKVTDPVSFQVHYEEGEL